MYLNLNVGLIETWVGPVWYILFLIEFGKLIAIITTGNGVSDQIQIKNGTESLC